MFSCGLSNIGVNSNGNPVYLTFSCANVSRFYRIVDEKLLLKLLSIFPNYFLIPGTRSVPFQQNPKGVAIHETLHALGLAHEHVRSDRDDHITVNWENVDPQNYQFFGINDAKLFTRSVD